MTFILSAWSLLKNIENFLYKKMWIYNFTVTIVFQQISRTFFVQNLIPYKTYIEEKHVESILRTCKNMTKKVFNWVSFFYRNNTIQIFCYCVSLSCFVCIYNNTVTIVSQKYWELCLIFETILDGFLYFRETTR